MKNRWSQMALLMTLGTLPLGTRAMASEFPSGSLFEVRSISGREMTLKFAEDSLTTAVKSATVCVQPPSPVVSVKLWMPDMGHGTSPTALGSEVSGCTPIHRINFLMGGLWELKVNFADGDSGVFMFDVSE